MGRLLLIFWAVLASGCSMQLHEGEGNGDGDMSHLLGMSPQPGVLLRGLANFSAPKPRAGIRNSNSKTGESFQTIQALYVGTADSDDSLAKLPEGTAPTPDSGPISLQNLSGSSVVTLGSTGRIVNGPTAYVKSLRTAPPVNVGDFVLSAVNDVVPARTSALWNKALIGFMSFGQPTAGLYGPYCADQGIVGPFCSLGLLANGFAVPLTASGPIGEIWQADISAIPDGGAITLAQFQPVNSSQLATSGSSLQLQVRVGDSIGHPVSNAIFSTTILVWYALQAPLIQSPESMR